MNPNNPFCGQQSGIFQSPSSSSVGTFQAPPRFRFGQSSVFGHSSVGTVQNPGFVPPGFPQPSGLGHASPRQTLGFGPASGFIPSYGLGQAAHFVPASAPTSSSIAIDQGFSFKPPTNLGTFQSPPNFGVATGEASSSGSVGSEFSFKTPENAMFKPILGAVSEPEKARNQIITAPFTFSHPGSSGHGGLAPFGLSQETSSSGNSTNFSFSKPVTSTNLPSSFASVLPSKTIEDEKRGPKPLFGSPSSSFTTFSSSSAGSLALGENFQVSKATKLEHEDPQTEPLPSLVKGMKRKEEQDHSPRRQDYDCGEESELASKSDRPPDKRPVRLNRPRGGGLFGRTLQDVLKSNKDGGRIKKETKKERVSLESGEIEPVASSGSGQHAFAIPQPSTPLKEEDFKEKTKEDSFVGTPARRNRSSDSVDSLGCLSPNELTSIQLKNVPEFLNDRNVLEKYFGHIAKVRRIFTRRNKKLAIIHFFDHASAVMARKKAKGFNKDIVTFWHKKKTGPAKREFSPKEKADEGEGRQSNEEQSYEHSPLRKSLIRSSAGSSLPSKSSPSKKSAFIKSLQFEADPFDSGSEGQSSESLGTSASSLSNLIGSVAETSEEKYRLLDQRDKIMRQARVKRTDLGKAKTIVGTCPDMCPEKERYMRETRNQLSILEVIPGSDKVDHRAAIKEYSRSSADQEEPLPHELRPSEVLSMTMDYLVTQIMDQGEGNYREWYDFVWNRTRGIRKDITQQHLCDPLTVSLIEKCTRFHIHCAHHLCEEPMSSFDAKINNENLTKCLQSLKEMYQDLGNKGLYCKSEAEFRGYNVLLTLNKGDILREVQQFHPSVRNSPEVRFAVQAFAALNSNNFVRFFKLVRAASYLNACLLHCYFNQIRREALKSLNFAYTVSPQRSTVFPLDSVVRMLLFKDCQEATHFINDYSLNVSDGYVELNRSAFLEPEVLPKPRKSLFIKQKLTVSVGEIVHGGPLPPVVHHIPICSFNGQNKYTGGTTTVESAGSSQKASIDMKVLAVEGRAEEKGLESEVAVIRVQPPCQPLPSLLSRPPAPLPPSAQSPFQPIVQPELAPPKLQPVYTDMDIAEVVENLVQDVLKGECKEIGKAGLAYVTAAMCASDAAIEELVTEVTMEVLRQVATDVFNAERDRVQEEKRRVEEERRKQEREQLIKQLSQSLGTELTEEVVKESVRETSASELKCALERDRRARIARCSEEVCADIMDLFLEEEIFQSAKETLQELQCFCKYLQRWREAVAARKKLKRQMRAFPAAPCCVDPKNKLKALSPSAECPIAEENLAKRIVNLGHAGKLGISCTRLRWLRNKTMHQMKVQYLYQLLLCDAAWTPLDLPSLITEHIQVQREQVFWKVLLVLPSYEEYPAKDPSRILADWLKAKFTADTRWKAQRDVTPSVNDRVQTLALYNSISMQENQAVHVSVCIKVAHGTLSDSELDMAETQKDLLGTSGLVLLLPPKVKSEDVAEEDVYWLSALLQLKQLLQAKPFHPIIPLVVLVPSQGEEATEKEVEEGLMLQDLISAQLISDYIIVEIPDSITDMQGTRKLSDAVQWLIAQCPSSLELCSQTLLQYIEDGVSHEFSERFYPDRRERRLAGLPSQEPGAIIDLYNSVLQFLAGVASSEQVCDLSWPVTEFVEPGGNKLLPHLQWNTADHLAWLKKAVLSFQIPYMDLPPLGAPWRPVCSMIFQYASQIASCVQTQPVIQSQVENLLSKTYCKWSGRLFASSEEDGPSVDDIPWDDILALCIDHKLRDWKPPKVPVAPEAVSKDGQIHVYFFKEHLKNFTVPFSWEQATLQTLKEIQQGHGRSRTKSPRSFSKHSPVSLPATEHDISLSTESRHELRLPTAADLTHTTSAKELLPEHLSSQLQLEKIESKRFEEQLHQWLAEDTGQLTDSLSLPFYLPQTLVATPQIIHPLIKTSTPCIPQAGNQVEEKKTAEGMGTSLSDKLKHLQRLIRANKEEQIACELHFSAVLDMTDI
ncbi:germinal-center associated nuclear protein [Alligator sinensis]|uniref:Germinal-center associated nuclear protein n=1 Tax=Alligator sinensis TaxID=38654 RepID=A0A1U7RQ70_ALLSI|nr:germinal-center associated nuclear protein [Alligator sinensis]XP_025057973.1 germinal-center associated nuclear protein [Alligator sinensis]